MSEIEESVAQHDATNAPAGDAAQTDESVKAKGRKAAAKKTAAKKTTTTAKAPSTGKKGTTTTAKGGKEDAMATKEKTTSKRGRKANTEKNATPARSMAITLGTTLVPLLGNKDARAIATRLKNNDIPSKRDLTSLRDAINEAAASAREGDKAPLASKLSSANRLVRRLIRQA